MAEKSEVVRARISTAAKARFEAVAAENGLSPSDFLRLMIDQETVDIEPKEDSKPRSRREA